MPINRGVWNCQERSQFRRAFNRYGKDLYLISKAIPTRTIYQVRSHAQKVIPKIIDQVNQIKRQKVLQTMIEHPRYLRQSFPAPEFFAPPLFPEFPPIRKKFNIISRYHSPVSKIHETQKLIKVQPQKRPSPNFTVKEQFTPQSQQENNDMWNSPSDGFENYHEEIYEMEEKEYSF